MSWYSTDVKALIEATQAQANETKKLNKKMDDIIAAILANGRIDPVSDFGKIRDILKGREE
jgi:hypothetical protein